jgi:threonine aldolase
MAERSKMLFGTGIAARDMIDLRSDVVTRPTPGMLKFMMQAEVGNDGWREDPTVNRLEYKVAQLLGKEKALIVPSGTMANEIAVRLLAHPGSEVIVERTSHIYNYEVAGPAALSGVQLLPVKGNSGILSWEDIIPNIRPPFHQFPKTACISLECTHNTGGGKIYPLNLIKTISGNAKEHGICLHLDGARLFNATAAAGIPPEEYCKHFDLVNICLSKGLGCPGGSVLAGSEELIEKAVLVRRQLGGSMRQIYGYMAGAGLYALEYHIHRLREDHRKAAMLAEVIDNSKGLILLDKPETNIVLFKSRTKAPEDICQLLMKKGILIAPYNYPLLRAVTHLDISLEDIRRVISTIRQIF